MSMTWRAIVACPHHKAEDSDKRASVLAGKLTKALADLQLGKEREALWGEERSRLAHDAGPCTLTRKKTHRCL